MQIVEHDSFKALNKADDKYGHYLVNSDKKLWFKYSTAEKGPWSFTFQPHELSALGKDLAARGETYVVLACGHHSICCLDGEKIRDLIDPSSKSAQWMKVDAPAAKQMRVTGSLNNKAPIKVAHNAFPNCMF